MNLINNIYNDKEYYKLIEDIVENEKFMKTSNTYHHGGGNRFIHSLLVSYYSYKISKRLTLDFKSTARAGLLHDFFTTEIEQNVVKRVKSFVFHPKYSLKNSKSEFNLNIKEENIITSHMFPVSIALPRYLESVIVSFVDKYVALYEFLLYYKSKLLVAKTTWSIILILNYI